MELTQEQIEAGKKLITDFMELKPKKIGDRFQYSDGVFFSVSEDSEEKALSAIYKYVKYYKEWNWLMPVVYEIGCRKDNKMGIVTLFGLQRTLIHCYIGDSRVHTIDVMEISGIEATFKAVVEYIEWFNQQK